MPLHFSLARLNFKNGTTVTLRRGDLVFFVGPNNSGKTRALRNIKECIGRPMPGPVITTVDVEREGTGEELQAWLDEHMYRNDERMPHYKGMGTSFMWDRGRDEWVNNQPISSLFSVLAIFADAATLPELAQASPSFDVRQDGPSNPLQELYVSADLEQAVGREFREAFDIGLFLDRWAGSHVFLHVGTPPDAPAGKFEMSRDWLRKLAKVPRLDEQGTGMRAFTGAVLGALAPERFVVMFDEPETFLHPPQSRLLGRRFAEWTSPDRQFVIATHSGDLLRGALDAKPECVRVIRLTRTAAGNGVTELPPDEVAKLWADPLLRYSNLLDGLFHEGVVLCEGDSDCRFYSALLSHMDDWPERPRDLMFTHCGGKDRLHVVAEALVRLKVPVQVIADFDVLRDETVLRRLVESLGGNFDAIRRDLTIMREPLDRRVPPLVASTVLAQLQKELAPLGAAELSPKQLEQFGKHLAWKADWSRAKDVGLALLPGGQASEAGVRLLEALRKIGLSVVPVGQLERWEPTAGEHGPKWLREVLTRDLKSDSLRAARAFVRETCAALRGRSP